MMVLAAVDGSWFWPALGLIVIPGLIVVNAFFVAAEFALVAVRRTRVLEMIQQGRHGAKALLHAVDRLDDSVAASQLGITVASLALGFASEPAVAALIHPLVGQLIGAGGHTTTHVIAVVITLLLVTYLHVVFGEQMPKIAALQSTERIGLLIAPPLNAFARGTRWLVIAMNGSSNFFLKRLGFKPTAENAEVHSVEELRLLVEDTEEAGLLGEEEADIVQNVFELSNKTVRESMVPRERMAGLDINMTSEAIMGAVRAGAHTRMPVYDGTFDKIVGIVNTKDLFYLFSLQGVVVLEDAIYPATYLEPDEPISNALKLLKKSRKPMALVRDADEKIIGLITLEDVVEEIVGDIEDEHDRPTRRLKVFRRRRR